MGLGRGVFSFILRNNQRSMLPLMFDTFGELCFHCVTGEERVVGTSIMTSLVGKWEGAVSPTL